MRCSPTSPRWDLTASADVEIGYTLDSLALLLEDSIVLTADGDATADHDTVSVTAGFTNNLTVDFDADTLAPNSVDATNYTGSLTVTAADTDLDGDAGGHVATIVGGTGTDTLKITANGGTIQVADMAQISKVERIEILANSTATTSLSLRDNNAVGANAATDETITVDASAMSVGVTINAANEDDAKVVITGGSGGDTITASTSAIGTSHYGDTTPQVRKTQSSLNYPSDCKRQCCWWCRHRYPLFL